MYHRGYRQYPYNSQGTFQLRTFPWGKDVLVIDLTYDHFCLDRAFEKATEANFWDDVRYTVMTACPSCEEHPHIPDLDHDLYFELKCSDEKDFEQQACKIKEILEQRAEKVYLRPGVPKLYTITKNYLKNKTNLVLSLIEFQEKYGYQQTKELVDQYEDVLLNSTNQ